MRSIAYRFTAFIVKVYVHITCRIHTEGMDKFPMQGPLIVIANHTGQIEVPLMFALLQPRKITGWAKVETWDNWDRDTARREFETFIASNPKPAGRRSTERLLEELRP